MTTYFDTFPPKPDDWTPKALSEAPTVHPTSILHDVHLGAWTEIGPGCRIVESTIGDYSYAADNVDMMYTTVGNFCSIASHVRINPGNHPMDRVSQHHFTYRRAMFALGDQDDAAFFDWRRADACTIGHDVWIGHGATIMAGVNVGTGAVIGAGAVVTKPIEPYTIVVGVPAHPIRKRFNDDVIAKLMQIAWWDWDHTTIKVRFDDFLNMQQFIEKYGK
jgi:hypothetical protein